MEEKESKKVGKIILLVLLICIAVGRFVSIREKFLAISSTNIYMNYKPVIYFYPEEEMDISISLDYNGELMYTYPKYENGWDITAYPDGTVIHNSKEYSYLFWEGITDVEYDLSKGFVIKGEDTVEFLQEKLAYLGLTPREYNEFIVFWLPLMEDNKYNLITFQEECYTDSAVLNIMPEPDSLQRVFMTFKALDKSIEIEEQVLEPFERSGYTVIEWGGSEIK